MVLGIWSALVFSFLYIPTIVLIVFSCNDASFSYHWSGFTLQWYRQLLATPELWRAVGTSLGIAVSAACISLLLGLMYVVWASRRARILSPLFYAGVALPEIVMAVGLVTFFSLMGIPLGYITVITGHVVIGLGFVVPLLRGRLAELDPALIEASYDLGASRMQTFFKVVIPFLFPALLSSTLIAFIVSFDDFLISFFCAGPSVQTISLYIYAMIRLGPSPLINALSCVMLVLSSVAVLLYCMTQTREQVEQ